MSTTEFEVAEPSDELVEALAEELSKVKRVEDVPPSIRRRVWRPVKLRLRPEVATANVVEASADLPAVLPPRTLRDVTDRVAAGAVPRVVANDLHGTRRGRRNA